jgi:general secretion pathway protein A
MVLDYYKLREQPFGVTPDSRFLFLSDTHKEALASLLYGIAADRGFVALIAPPGLGKTTLLFHALKQLRDTTKTVFLFQTILTPVDLLQAILSDLGVQETGGTLVEMQSLLNEILVNQARAGKRLVVVIDEAQNLDDSVLEFVRTLSNFETSQTKLIQIILSGQPGLADKLGSPKLVQLRQRISIIARLKPFSRAETALYIDHRVRTAGYDFESPLFTPEAVEMIAGYSEGVPRNINNFCFNALSLACASQRKTVSGDMVREVAADLDLDWLRKKSDPPAAPIEAAPRVSSFPAGQFSKLAIALMALLVFGGTIFGSYRWPVARAASNTSSSVLSHGSVAPSPSESIQELAAKKSAEPVPSRGEDQLQQPRMSAEIVPQDRVAMPASVVSTSLSAHQNPQSVVYAKTILVKPGRTLIGICSDTFGSCNPDLLQEVHRLNPQLSNFDHIEPGQTIRFPLVPQISASVHGSTERPGSSSVAERGHNE